MEWLSEELVLYGTYSCTSIGYDLSLMTSIWALIAIWEVLALCLTVLIAVKHIRELQRPVIGSRDYISVLIKNHTFYFTG